MKPSDSAPGRLLLERAAGAARGDVVRGTAGIVAAYVGNSTLPPWELAGLIKGIHQALVKATSEPAAAPPEPLMPAVPIRHSVGGDHLVCLEDGMRFTSLRRHLRIKHGLSPQEYRQRWGLPADYPMVAPSYGIARSALAKEMGLGRKRTPPPRDPRAGRPPEG